MTDRTPLPMPANPDHSADEPTEKMIDAASPWFVTYIHMRPHDRRNAIVNAYKAMRAARPEAQAAPKLTEEMLSGVQINSWRHEILNATQWTGFARDQLNRLCDQALASLHAQAGVSEQQADHSENASQRARSPE